MHVVFNQGFIKLGDFGFAKVLDGNNRTYTFCGTPGEHECSTQRLMARHRQACAAVGAWPCMHVGGGGGGGGRPPPTCGVPAPFARQCQLRSCACTTGGKRLSAPLIVLGCVLHTANCCVCRLPRQEGECPASPAGHAAPCVLCSSHDTAHALCTACSRLQRPGYVAPENVLAHGYNASVDWWGLGVLLYVLLTGRQPFSRFVTVPVVRG